MEVVLLLVAIAGIALIAVPRLQARRASAARTASARAARSSRRPAVAAAAVPTWAPSASDDEIWDDGLGWEGEDPSPPTAPREEADRRRERAAAPDDGWLDDDGL